MRVWNTDKWHATRGGHPKQSKWGKFTRMKCQSWKCKAYTGGVLLWLFLLVLVSILRGLLLGFAGFNRFVSILWKMSPSLFFHSPPPFFFIGCVFGYGFSSGCNGMKFMSTVWQAGLLEKEGTSPLTRFVSPILSTTLVLPLALFFAFFQTHDRKLNRNKF